jgi:hypothetical protein
MDFFWTGMLVVLAQIVITLVRSRFRGWPTLMVWGISWVIGMHGVFLVFVLPTTVGVFVVCSSCGLSGQAESMARPSFGALVDRNRESISIW